jgi:hypothetical protein
MPDSLSALPRIDMTRIAAAVIFFIASFLPFVGVSVGGLSGGFKLSVSIDAWHSFALLGVLLFLAAVVVWALQRFSSVELPTWRVAWSVAIPALAAIGTALVALRAITYGSGVGLRYGAVLLVLSGIVFVVSTFDRKAVSAAD